MSAPKDLREVVAGLCKCPPESIGPDFSLDVPALRGSLKKAVLIASIRRYLGKDCMAAATARTFAELEAMVSGKAPAAPAPAAEASAQPPAAPCGIDMETLSALPQSRGSISRRAGAPRRPCASASRHSCARPAAGWSSSAGPPGPSPCGPRAGTFRMP